MFAMKYFGHLSAILVIFLLLLTIACTKSSSPWSNVKVYTDAGKKITVNTGQEFVIRFTVSYDLFPIIKEIHDDNKVYLSDRKTDAADEQNQSPRYSWFLFKALEAGETQITIEHRTHLVQILQDEQTFTVVIK